MEDNGEEQANAVEQAFLLELEVAQMFCSYIVPKAVLLFTGEALIDGMDFEPEYGEGYDDDEKGGDDEVWVLPFRPQLRRGVNDYNPF